MGFHILNKQVPVENAGRVQANPVKGRGKQFLPADVQKEG